MNNRKLKKFLRQNAIDGDMTQRSGKRHTLLRRMTQVVACLMAVCLIGVGYVTLVRFVGRPGDDTSNDPGADPANPIETESRDTSSAAQSNDTQTEISTPSPTIPASLSGASIDALSVMGNYATEFGQAERIGEWLDQMQYKRTVQAEEALSCTVNTLYCESDDALIKLVSNRVLSAEGDHSIVAARSDTVMSMTTSGLLSDLMQSRGIDFESAAWDAEMTDALSIGGKLYFATGRISPNALLSLKLMVGDSAMLRAAGIDNAETIVLEGKWTLETVLALEGMSLGLNGEADVSALLGASGIRLADSTPGLSSAWSDGTLSAFCSLLRGAGQSVRLADRERAMLSIVEVGQITEYFAEESSDYCLLPLPAMNADNGYRSPLGNSAFYYALPVQSGASITESAALIGKLADLTDYESIAETLTFRCPTTKRGAEMLELVLDNIFYSLDPLCSLDERLTLSEIVSGGESEAVISRSSRIADGLIEQIARKTAE